jgi:hypothetical protein
LAEKLQQTTPQEYAYAPPLHDGWKVTISGREAGAGSFGPIRVPPFISPTLATIDVTSRLPAEMSRRLVSITVEATTTQHVTTAGTWIYGIRFDSKSYTQCVRFDFQSDGHSVGEASITEGINASRELPQSVKLSVDHSRGDHQLMLSLSCYITNAQFPLINITLNGPDQTVTRQPVKGEFTVRE